MKQPWSCAAFAALLAGCAADTPFPARASEEELQQLATQFMEQYQNTPRADDLRTYGIYLQQADGSYPAEKGAVFAVPQEDGSFLVAFYNPRGDTFERIGEPVRVEGTGAPHVGNPRNEATCLRAAMLDGSGKWYGCVEQGRIVTGVEQAPAEP